MNEVGKDRVSRMIGVLSLGSVVSFGGCVASTDSTTTNAEDLSAGRRNDQGEILRCCERRFPPRQRAECFFESLRDRGVCAPGGAGGAAGASGPGGAGGKGAAGGSGGAGTSGGASGSGDCALIIEAITPPRSVFPINGTVPLVVQAFDPNHPTAAQTILWSSPTGSIVGATSSPATFQCTQPASTNNVTVTVSEGTCTVTASTTIACGSCGDGILDPGEQCDPPNGTTCDSVCQTLTPGCNCELPDGQLCVSCEYTACGECFLASLFPMNVPNGSDPIVCDTLGGADRTNCLALVNCESASLASCAVNGLIGCYCSNSTCSAGVDGICAAEINAVAGTSDPAAVIAQLQNPLGLLAQIRNLELSFAHSACGLPCSSP